MSVNSHISKQQETLYLQNLVSAYASIGYHPCYSYRKTGAGINNIVRKIRNTKKISFPSEKFSKFQSERDIHYSHRKSDRDLVLGTKMLYTQNCTKAAIIKMLLDPDYYYEIGKKLPTNLKKEFNVSNLKQEQQNHFFSNQFDFDSLETRPITSTNDRDKLWAAATEEAIISDRRFPQIDDNRADNPPAPQSPEKITLNT